MELIVADEILRNALLVSGASAGWLGILEGPTYRKISALGISVGDLSPLDAFSAESFTRGEGGYRCHHLIPIHSREQPRLGALVLLHSEPFEFSATQESVLQSLADYAAASAELVRLRTLRNSFRLVILGEIAAGLVHQMNNLLAIIAGKASALNEYIGTTTLSPEDLKKYADSVERNTLKMSGFVKRIRDFSQATQQETVELVPVSELIDGAYELLVEALKKSGVRYRRGEISPDLKLRCRPMRVMQALLLLLKNGLAAAAVSDPHELAITADASPTGGIVFSIVASGLPSVHRTPMQWMEMEFATEVIEGHGGQLTQIAAPSGLQMRAHFP